MISFLRGRLAARGAGWVELDVGGVGFRLLVSGHALRALPAPGGEVTLPTMLVVREDAFLLFGFRDDDERAAFESLIAVAGIGPRTALAVLSQFHPQELAQALANEDVTALTRVPGVGRKTAQRLVLELRGQLATDGAAQLASAPSGAAAEAQAALMALGYGASEAASAVAAAADPAADSAGLVRLALRQLGGR